MTRMLRTVLFLVVILRGQLAVGPPATADDDAGNLQRFTYTSARGTTLTWCTRHGPTTGRGAYAAGSLAPLRAMKCPI